MKRDQQTSVHKLKIRGLLSISLKSWGFFKEKLHRLYNFVFLLDKGEEREKDRERNISVRKTAIRWLSRGPNQGQTATHTRALNGKSNRRPPALWDGIILSHLNQ